MSRKRRGQQRQQKRARERAAVILSVLSGRITATEAAKRLGVSRKTYYKWEERALQGVESALNDRDGGRPPTPQDPEKEALKKENEELSKQVEVLRQTLQLRESLAELLGTRGAGRSNRPARPRRKNVKERAVKEAGGTPEAEYGQEKKRAERES